MGRMQLACVLLAILAPVSCQSSQDSFDKLRKSLLGTYDKGALPFVPTGLQVEFELVLTTLIEVNTAGESIEFESWWRMYWTDPRLSWDPAQHGGMTQIVLKHTEVWRPDVILFEKIKDVISTTRVQVSSTGDVLWSAPHITKLGCPMSVEVTSRIRTVLPVPAWTAQCRLQATELNVWTSRPGVPLRHTDLQLHNW